MKELTVKAATLMDLLRWRALHQPNRHAYTFLLEDGSEVRYTYDELDEKARELAARLQSNNTLGERALLLYQPGIDYIIAFFGCLYAGVVPVPAYPPRQNGNLTRLQAIVKDARATLSLTTSALLTGIERRFADSQELASLQWVTTDLPAQETAADWQEPLLTSDSLAFLQYTSGSTSLPKGVMLSHGNLLHNLELIQNSFGTTSESRGVVWLPPYHDMGLIGGILQPLYTGYPMTLMAPVDFITKPLRWLEAISQTKATVSGGPNFAYELCVQKITPEQRDQLDLSSWEQAFSGAEPIRHETLGRFAEYFAPAGFREEMFYPCYGLAEGTLFVSGGLQQEAPIIRHFEGEALEQNEAVLASEAGDLARTLVSSGRPALGNQKVVIADPQSSTTLPEGQVGEIWVCGPSIAQGYWDRPQQTEETFRAFLTDTGEGPFLRTGDLGFLQEGELYVTGRLKDLIIIRGRNYYPQDIEFAVMESHPAVGNSNGAAFAVEVDGEERLVIVYELERKFRKSNHEEVVQAIRQAVSLQHQLQVHAVVLIKPASIPKTSSGKIQRHMCRERFLNETLEVVHSDMQGASAESGTGADVAEDALAVVEDLSRESLLALSVEERQGALQSYLLHKAAEALKLPSSQIAPEQALNMLGLDSMMAVELKSGIEENFGVDVPLVSFLDGLTLADMVSRVLAETTEVTDESQETASNAAAVSASEFPLSTGQQSLYFLQRLAPESAPYNISRAVRIVGEFNATALRDAVMAVVKRHPLLRVTFSMRGVQPLQHVQDDANAIWQEHEASAWSAQELEAQLNEAANRPFDLEHDLPLRVQLFRTGAEAVLLVTAHHVVTDFWSFGVFADDLQKAYGAQVRGASLDLPTTRSYGEYVQWQHDLLNGPRGEELFAFWKNRLGGSLPVLSLPTDRPRPPVQTYRGAAHSFRLNAAVAERLKELAKQQGVTLYVALLAVFQLLLHRYTGQDDILVGSPTTGRSSSKFNDVMGYFVNPVVMRAAFPDGISYSGFLQQVRQTVLDALKHQDYPFALLADRLQPKRDMSYSPIFQAMFTFQKSHLAEDDSMTALALNEAGARVQLGDLALESVKLEQRYAQLDLTLLMGELDGTLAGTFEYNADLFDANTLERMSQHFEKLLEGIVSAPEQDVAKLPMMTEEETEQIVVAWNETQADYRTDVTLNQLFEEQAARTPDRVALVFEGEALTYAQLNQRANRLAHHLQAQGVGPEMLVGVCMERSLELVVSLFAIHKAGAAYVPIDPSYPSDRLAFMLEDASVHVLLTQERLLELLPESQAQVICLDREEANLPERTDPVVQTNNADNIAYMIYTSGSTGRPKGVLNTHRGIVNRLLWMQDAYQLTEQDHVLQKTPFSFDVSVWEFFWPLITGARLVVARPEGHRDSNYLVGLIEQEQITTLHFVPSMLQVFLLEKGIEERCTSIRQVMCSGEALPFELQQKFFSRMGAKLHNLYGPTEAAVDVTFWECERDSQRQSVPIGRPVGNTKMYVLDRYLQPVPAGVAGELHIGGVQVARGYHNRPDLTAEKFIADPFTEGGRLYKTGDLARFLKDGVIEYLGRIDHQVKLRGFRIELGEIEEAIQKHEGVREAVVIARHSAAGDLYLAAYGVSSAEAVPTAEDLREFLKQALPEYMVPTTFVFLEEMPLSPSGKADRKALPDPAEQIVKTDVPYVAPSNDIERKIAAVWQEVLLVEQIGVNDNFFDIGGNSLRMAQVHGKLREELDDSAIELVQLYQNPTISALAKTLGHIAKKENTAEAGRNRAANRREMMQQMRGRNKRK